MKQIEIKDWRNGKVILCGQYESIRDCLEKNRSADLSYADLRYADLSYANLRYADLSSADLSYANLSSADLSYANLRYANLSYANLSSADLSSADLSYANLRYADLSYANLRYADLSYADLSYANLRYADLSYADLSYANLSYADLRSADLSYADLRYADLSYANLRSADLRSAKYKEPLFLPDLYSLKLLPANTVLRFWKYLTNGKSPYQNSEYKVGKIYKTDKYDKDENELCGIGLSVATLVWCLKDNINADEFMEVEFKVKDIVAVPFVTDGKFRVKNFKVVKKINRKKAVALLNKAMGKK